MKIPVNTLILRTVTPFLTALMLLFSVFVLLRGHNEPGGGFIGGLIAACAFAIYGIAFGVGTVRQALFFRPMSIAAFGLFAAVLAGLISMAAAVPFMTGIWFEAEILGTTVPLSTVMLFDAGVYLVVVGTVTAIALVLEEEGD